MGITLRRRNSEYGFSGAGSPSEVEVRRTRRGEALPRSGRRRRSGGCCSRSRAAGSGRQACPGGRRRAAFAPKEHLARAGARDVDRDLRARVAGADDEHPQAAIRVAAAVVRGVHELAGERPRPRQVGGGHCCSRSRPRRARRTPARRPVATTQPSFVRSTRSTVTPVRTASACVAAYARRYSTTSSRDGHLPNERGMPYPGNPESQRTVWRWRQSYRACQAAPTSSRSRTTTSAPARRSIAAHCEPCGAATDDADHGGPSLVAGAVSITST